MTRRTNKEETRTEPVVTLAQYSDGEDEAGWKKYRAFCLVTMKWLAGRIAARGCRKSSSSSWLEGGAVSSDWSDRRRVDTKWGWRVAEQSLQVQGEEGREGREGRHRPEGQCWHRILDIWRGRWGRNYISLTQYV